MKIVWKCLLITSVLLFIAGCGGDDNEKDDYSGVGKLIADRHKARVQKASSGSQDNSDTDTYTSKYKDSPPSEPEKRSSGLTFEENVKIVSEVSGKTIARATAYLDKSGKLINIRIRKNR